MPGSPMTAMSELEAPMRAQPERVLAEDPASPPETQSATQALRDAVLAGDGEAVFIEELIDRLQGRAFGLGVLLFMAPVCLPMPPGVHTLAGLLLLLFAIQLVMGRRRLWLPNWIRKKRIQKDKIIRGLDRMARFTNVVERVARPRWLFMTGGAGKRAVGVVLIVLAIVLILPIPILGNLPPAVAACVLALSLAERDGLLVLAGLITSAAAIAFTSALAFAVLNSLSALV